MFDQIQVSNADDGDPTISFSFLCDFFFKHLFFSVRKRESTEGCECISYWLFSEWLFFLVFSFIPVGEVYGSGERK